MATWDKDTIIIPLFNETTGALDTSVHTVEVYPVTNTYPTGKVTCTQLSCGYSYKPDSDLDDETQYWVRVDGTDKRQIFPPKAYPGIGA